MNSKIPAKKILLAGEGSRAMLTAIQSCGRMGMYIGVMSKTFSGIEFKSKYIDEYLQYQNYNEEIVPVELIQRINIYDLILPITDYYCLFFHKNRAFLDGKVFIPEKKLFNTCFSKIQILEKAKQLEIPTGRFYVKKTNDLLQNKLEYPFFIKNEYSVDSLINEERNNTYFITNKEQLNLVLANQSINNRFLIQYPFIGTGIGFNFYSENGQILSYFMHKRIHESNSGGSSYRKSITQIEEICESSEKLIREIGYSGIGMIEFRYNYIDNSYILLEFNSRPWGSIPLAKKCGIDFIEIMIKRKTEKLYRITTNKKKDIYCRNLLLDISIIKNNDKLSSIKQLYWFIKRLMMNKERIDTFNIYDFRPFIAEIKEIIYKSYRIITYFCFKYLLKFNFIRYYFRKRLEKRLRNNKDKKIMFVCHGNLYRSAFCHIYIKSITNDVPVDSCGLTKNTGKNMLNKYKSFFDKLGVNGINIISKSIHEIDHNEYNIFIIYDYINLYNILKDTKIPHYKIYLISLLSKYCFYEISDPDKKSRALVIATLYQLKLLCDKLLKISL